MKSWLVKFWDPTLDRGCPYRSIKSDPSEKWSTLTRLWIYWFYQFKCYIPFNLSRAIFIHTLVHIPQNQKLLERERGWLHKAKGSWRQSRYISLGHLVTALPSCFLYHSKKLLFYYLFISKNLLDIYIYTQAIQIVFPKPPIPVTSNASVSLILEIELFFVQPPTFLLSLSLWFLELNLEKKNGGQKIF